MNVDRWVIPPAVAAAVFALIAIAPPRRDGSLQGLRVEVAGGATPGRALLVRVGLDDPTRDSLSAPERGWVELLARPTGRVLDRIELHGEEGTSYATGRLRVAGEGPWEIRVAAAGERASARVPEAALVPAPHGAAQPPGRIALAVEGGALVPAVPAAVLVRCPGATEVALTAEGEGIVLDPARAVTDGCGVAAFRVTVTGLDAPVHVTAAGASTRQRLPVDAGALGVAVEPGRLVARAAVGARELYALAGDANGATWWGVARFHQVPEGVRAQVALPSDAAWAVASLSPVGTEAVGAWVAPPAAIVPVEPCLASAGEVARRWFAWTAPRPALPSVRTVYDGLARARDRRASGAERVRLLALAFLGAAVLLEVALVLGAGLQPLPGALRGLSRQRWGLLVGGVAVLLLAGFVLALNVLMRTPGG